MSKTIDPPKDERSGSTVCSPAVKERPILFSGEMVRAILAGRKTQTRRAVKGTNDCQHLDSLTHVWRFTHSDGSGGNQSKDIECPYGQPGERLWVRETFNTVYREADEGWNPSGDVPIYRADEEHDEDVKWKPSIFMPRWASRITLEITSVHVERLQEISKDDAEEEGTPSELMPIDVSRMPYPSSMIQGAFAALWESINGKGSWDANPWVWVVHFRMI